MSWGQRRDDPDSNKKDFQLVGQLQDELHARRHDRHPFADANTIVVLGTNFIARYPEAHGSALEIFQRK